MSSPERKAAERIFRYLFTTEMEEGDRKRIAAIIAEEHAPMRAMMERMVGIIAPNQAMHDTCGCPECVEGRAVLTDYAEMKAGWEAPDVRD